MSLYKPKEQIYRAGVSVAAEPQQLPAGVRTVKFGGGNYGRFVLTGPYADLAAASERVFKIICQAKLPLREDYFLENYVNDPRTTPPEQLITEILVPLV